MYRVIIQGNIIILRVYISMMSYIHVEDLVHQMEVELKRET